MDLRKIKFRGKCLDDGNWVFGDLQHPHTSCRIVSYDESKTDMGVLTDFQYNDVIPETIGQFTGLLDANGKEIYEGDIVKFRVLDDTISENVWKEYIYEVSFCNGCFCTYGTPLIKGKWKGYDTVNVKIIGNIHDTPELLNEK